MVALKDQIDRPSGIRSSVWFYLLVAFGISWITYFIRKAIDWPAPVDQTLRMIVKFGPSVAGLIAAFRFFGAAGPKDILRRLVSFRVHVGWYLLALFLPLVVVMVTLPIRHGIGGDVWSNRDFNLTEVLPLYGTLLATRFFAGGGLGEELGWRGFMLPQLQGHMGAFRASVVIGIAHGTWHLPSFGVAAIPLTVFTIAGAIIMTWMYNRTRGNLLLPTLWHASSNATLPVLEQIFPAIDNEFLFPLMVIGMWALLAGLLVWRVGVRGFEIQQT